MKHISLYKQTLYKQIILQVSVFSLEGREPYCNYVVRCEPKGPVTSKMELFATIVNDVALLSVLPVLENDLKHIA